MNETQTRLTTKQKLGFGICDLGGNMFFTLMSFWVLRYLTDTVGLAAVWAGAVFMISRYWDAISDPLMGFISDRTLSRWGRRRVYLLFGALPLCFAMWFFFTAPSYLSSNLHIIWALVALILLNTASTVVNVPYGALTPELTSDYNEQSSLNGYRFGCAVFGTLIGAGAVQPLVQLFSAPAASNPLTDARGFSFMGLFLGAIMMLVTLITFFGTKEKKRNKEDLPTGSFLSAFSVFKNRPFRFLLITYALHITGITFLTSILVYYTESILHRPDITTPAMLLLLLTAMVFIPVSVLVSKKIGKRRTYQICFLILSSVCAIIFFLGHVLPLNFFLALMVYAGIGVGFSYVAPFAMIPDTIEYEAAKTGELKEGAYYGMWTFISKLGIGLANFFTGLILSMGGYISQAGALAQPGSVSTAIRIIIGPIPTVILLAAFVVIGCYPLDRKPLDKSTGKNINNNIQ
jgi:GPH family glycoside/pentoside/hexuronide:cation symporter